MKLLILYSSGPVNSPIVSKLSDQFKDVLLVEEQQKPLQLLMRVFKRKNHTFLNKINQLLFFIYYFFFLSSDVSKTFGKVFNTKQIHSPDQITTLVNDQKLIDSSKLFFPNLILVLGTSLLSDRWYEIGAPIVNVHLGIMPKYRGRFCWFWAILNEDFDSVGLSVHYVSKIPDSGKIVLQDRLDLSKLKTLNLSELLLHLTFLIDKNIAKALKLVINSRIENSILYSSTLALKNSHYFEPGITDYIKFQRTKKKLINKLNQ